MQNRHKGSLPKVGGTTSAAIASIIGLTGTAMMASQALAQTASGLAGVQSATVGSDGFLNQVLQKGQQLVIEAGQFSIGANGAIVLSEAALAQVAQALILSGVAVTGAAAGGAALIVAARETDTPNDGPNSPAVIGGAVADAVTKSQLTASGSLNDIDTGQAVFVVHSTVAGSYGSFSLAADGAWTYLANNGQSAIQSLGAGQTLTDSFTAVTADGATQTVTINGADDPIPAIQLSALQAGIGGFVLNGTTLGDQAGSAVSAAGEVNGDGFDDLIIGAQLVDQNGLNSGASYVVFGSNLTNALTQLGDGSDNILTGTAGGDVIFGAQGYNTPDWGGGSDRLSGGSGADTFVVRDLAGTVTVIDFTASEGDRLNLTAFGFDDFNAFESSLSLHGPGNHYVRVTLDNDTFLILQGIEPSDLTASNVILATPNVV